MRSARVWFVAVALLATAFLLTPLGRVTGAPQPFTFAAAGDFGVGANSAATLGRVGTSGSQFFLALGDLSYNGTGSESSWCSFVKSKVGPTYPFELLSGHHEDNGPDGLIDNFVQCLPDRLDNLVGTYGKEYYFDYPASQPMARFILISPGLSFTYGGAYYYKILTSHYVWLANAIDDARTKGIPWVIVGMHVNCITAGSNDCETTQDLMDLLVAKKVDLVLQAHDDEYQRSKQLTCGIRSFYVPECVANDGSTGTYVKGAGSVIVIAGTGGARSKLINESDVERPYFTSAVMGSSTTGVGFGFVSYLVSPDRIDAQTNFSGTFQDRFSIVQPNPSLSSGFIYSPGNPPPQSTVSFSATASGGTPPYSYAWDFSGGPKGSGAFVTHRFGPANTYTVTLAVTDAAGAISQTAKDVVVGGPPPPSFSVGAAGDFGVSANAAATLSRINGSVANFFLAVGDLSYNGSGSEPSWCNFVTSRVGVSYPFEILAGNHEDSGPDGYIENYTTCLPDRLGNLVGAYGKEYYFDYPSGQPLARFIQVSPDLTFTDGYYGYQPGTTHWNWLASAIDGARSNGIPWVIVDMHKLCISTGGEQCEVGFYVTDLLTAKKVDIVLQGHAHGYQRSKQMSCTVRNYYASNCITNDGSTGLYSGGAGIIYIIDGTGGAPLSPISSSDSERPYFTNALMGSNTLGYGFGFVVYTITAGSISAQTNFSGSFQDSFSIVRP